MLDRKVPAVMTVSEVARFLKCAQITVYRLAERGQLPGTKIGRSWRFDSATMERWIRRCERTAAREPRGRDSADGDAFSVTKQNSLDI
jgi:excisionase family DNA binding protein